LQLSFKKAHFSKKTPRIVRGHIVSQNLHLVTLYFVSSAFRLAVPQKTCRENPTSFDTARDDAEGSLSPLFSDFRGLAIVISRPKRWALGTWREKVRKNLLHYLP